MNAVENPARNTGERQTGNDRVKELRKRIDDSVDTLAKAVDEVRASATFKAYLDIQSRFHHYSWCNSLLILSQRPDASRVAGYKTWQSLGRQVRKGERGIMIFAPCPWKRERQRENGETETEKGMFFRAVHVFDVGQTDGPDLPAVDVPLVDSDATELLATLERVAVERGIAVAYQKLDGNRLGYATDKGKSVVIDDTYATGQRAKTLAHELGHCALHWEDRGPLTRSIAELEAESVAYVVCRHFGLDVEVRASRYIALWQGDSKSLRASLERIANTARELIDDVEAVGDRKAVAA